MKIIVSHEDEQQKIALSLGEQYFFDYDVNVLRSWIELKLKEVFDSPKYHHYLKNGVKIEKTNEY